jgi:hypothetical protein
MSSINVNFRLIILISRSKFEAIFPTDCHGPRTHGARPIFETPTSEIDEPSWYTCNASGTGCIRHGEHKSFRTRQMRSWWCGRERGGGWGEVSATLSPISTVSHGGPPIPRADRVAVRRGPTPFDYAQDRLGRSLRFMTRSRVGAELVSAPTRHVKDPRGLQYREQTSSIRERGRCAPLTIDRAFRNVHWTTEEPMAMTGTSTWQGGCREPR